MKKGLLAGVLVIIAIAGTLITLAVKDADAEMEEFIAFREYLDIEYFPAFNKATEHIEVAADKISTWEFADWYLGETGLEENYEIQRELEQLKENLINKDVEHPDTLKLKKNILNQIGLLEDSFETLNLNSTSSDIDELQLLDDMVSQDINNLSKNIEEMNDILSEYYE